LKFRVKWSHVYRFYEAVEPFLKMSLPLEEKPIGERILVLSPHIDDETIGCGGTIHKHSAFGEHVTVLYVADCTPNRIQEGENAAKVLGISKTIFWEYQSKTLNRYPEIENRIGDLLIDIGPDIVYIPSLIDRHNDHVTLNYYFSKALNRVKKKFMIYSYEVWTTLIPNVVIDISDLVEIKRNAMNCYQSQLVSHNWLEGTLALNRYRGMISGARSHGEAFFRLTPQKYLKLWKDLYG
jgi:N-acetylglucosamine malate deacetylase 1